MRSEEAIHKHMDGRHRIYSKPIFPCSKAHSRNLRLVVVRLQLAGSIILITRNQCGAEIQFSGFRNLKMRFPPNTGRNDNTESLSTRFCGARAVPTGTRGIIAKTPVLEDNQQKVSEAGSFNLPSSQF